MFTRHNRIGTQIKQQQLEQDTQDKLKFKPYKFTMEMGRRA